MLVDELERLCDIVECEMLGCKAGEIDAAAADCLNGLLIVLADQAPGNPAD